MVDLDAKGMKAADLTEEQIAQLHRTEQKLNSASDINQEIYLLAITR